MPLLQTSTAEGALKGMVTARAPHELQEQEVAYLQDAVINQPGFVNRRGAITGTTAITNTNIDSTRPMAACSVFDPAGVQKIGLVYLKDTGSVYEVWMAVYTPTFTFIQKHLLMATLGGAVLYPGRTPFIQCTPAIDGSIIISVRNTYGRNLAAVPTAQARVIRWYGGCPTTSIAGGGGGPATVASTEGSTAVTGAAGEIAKVSFPGTVIGNLGVVASVTSTTQVELMFPATRTIGASAFSFYIIENLPVFRARGKVSCSAGVLTGLTGYGTKFTEMRDRAGITPATGFSFLDATTMKLLATLTANNPAPAASDTVSGVPTTVNRSASMKNYLLYANEGLSDPHFNRFVQPPGTVNPIPPKAVKGSFWTTYKGYMISFNAVVETLQGADAGDLATTGRGYVHGPRFPEIMDHSVADGDWFEVQSTKQGDPDGVACQGGNNSTILCKAQETFALLGDNPDNFEVNKVADDGALTFESVTTYRGNPIWLGRTGIWMYNGNEALAENIIADTLGTKWKDMVGAFDGTAVGVQDSDKYMTNQARCFVYKDYLFVNVTNVANYSIYTDGVQRASTTMQLMIYLPTMAVSFLTNFNFQAFLQIGTAGYVILPQLGSTTHHWFPLDNLFTQGLATTDSILTANSYNSGSVPTSVGPWFHMESRRSDIGDGLLKKNWKQLATESKLTNAKQMWLETVAGLNVTGVRAALPFVGTGSYKAARVKFRTRDQYMGFRLYEDINNRPATLSLGAWQWAFKPARRGAV